MNFSRSIWEIGRFIVILNLMTTISTRIRIQRIFAVVRLVNLLVRFVTTELTTHRQHSKKKKTERKMYVFVLGYEMGRGRRNMET